MNRGARSFFNIVHWPIWVKIATLVGVGLITLAVPSFLTVRSATLESGIDNTQSYLRLNGTDHLASIGRLLDRAQADLQAFVTDETQRQRLLSILLDRPAVDGPAFNADTLLADSLLSPATTLYDNVRLLNAEGIVLASAAIDANDVANVTGVSQAGTAAFLEGLTALAEGAQRTLAVSTVAENAVIDVAEAIVRRDGELAGFLIARIAQAQIVSALENVYREYPATTFLISEQGAVFATGDSPVNNALLRESPGALNALAGQSGVDRYVYAVGEEVLGYFTPVTGTRLALVSEIRVEDALARASEYFSARAFVLFTGGAALAAIMIVLLAWLNQLITPPVIRLRRAAQALAQGDFAHPVPDIQRGDEIGALASSFVIMRDQVQSLVAELEARLAARARDIATTQQISLFAATQHDLQTLLDSVVNLMIERFPNIYHAQIFLVDHESRTAILRASTGEAGKQLLARGHRLPVNSISLIGQATGQKRVAVARDTRVDPVHKQQELLPETRAELAIPLQFGDRVIGALDVQSKQRDAFSPEQTDVLQTVANQIAVAIQTSHLYEESIRRLAQIEASNRQATLHAWQDYMRTQRQKELSGTAGTQPNGSLSSLRHAAMTSGQIVVGTITNHQTMPIAVPIQLGGLVLGVVEWEIPAVDFNEEKLELARELAARLAVGLENARLFEESRRAAERERLVNSIAARLTAQTDINEILQTAVREVGQALRTPQVSIQLLDMDAKSNGSTENRLS